MIYVFIAEGFEEIEALGTVDILRRCGFDVMTVGVKKMDITGAHGMTVLCDTIDALIELNDDLQAIVLPGGMPGTLNEEKSEYVRSAIDYCAKNGRKICAICAAPSILGHKGLLDGKKATCYPGFENQLGNAEHINISAVRDGDFVTANGPGAVFDFGFEIAKALGKDEQAQSVKESMQCVR